MALKVLPGKIEMERMEESSETQLTLENTSSKPIHYKFRMPHSNVLTVSPTAGKLLSEEKTEVTVSYDSSLNDSDNSLIAFQLKFVHVEGDNDDSTQQVFTDHKDDAETKYLNVTFADQIDEDDFFTSPPDTSMWWRKKKKSS